MIYLDKYIWPKLGRKPYVIENITYLQYRIFFSTLFSKTGTLTEGNLDLKGVVESRGTGLNEMVADPTQLPLDSPIVQAMATCHSLIKLKGNLTGNPLDVKLFEGIEWVTIYCLILYYIF